MKFKTFEKIFIPILIIIVSLQFSLEFSLEALAQQGSNVELNGDIVEYSMDGQTVTAEGNVKIFYKGARLFCDKVEFSRADNIANANGRVRLITKEGEIRGDKLTFNFDTMKGDFEDAKIFSYPFYGKARKIKRVSDKLLVMLDGYMTTSDYDDPGYRLVSSYIDVYPKDKIVARNVKMKIGKVPVFYSPRYTQNLKDKKPWLILTPGYDKEWGMFLLSQIRYFKNENFKATFHLDFREKKDVASGVDFDYRTESFGEGLVRLYYMNERSITSNRWYQQRPSPTIERERFKAEWRHKWQINENTSAIAQYYKISDTTFLKDYFEREYDQDSSPDTYFLLTRSFKHGVLSVRADGRVNRFESGVERLPEVRYDLSSYEIGNTNLYLKNISSFSNLVYEEASPTEYNTNTIRFNLDNEISYPTKIGFVEFKPYIGTIQTFYSRLQDESKNDSIRGQFKTGASLSTKFFKLFNLNREYFGMDDTRMRHVVSPTITYDYANEPTILNSDIYAFDSVDSLTNIHKINFSLENKLQIKREGQSVDIFRALISSDYPLKEDPARQGFSVIESDFEFKPNGWLTLYADSEYNTKGDYLSTANFDIYINGGNKWELGVGKRFSRNVDDILTTNLRYRINRKWAIKIYDRFDVNSGILQEQDYVLSRDLHSWEMEFNYNQSRGEGSEILVVFRLKAFPEIGIDAGTSFNKRKAGSQSSEGE